MGMTNTMVTATMAEVQRDFATWQERALTQPVGVTDGGMPRTVIVSAEEYQRLKRRDRQALRVEQLDGRTLAALASAEPPEEAAVYDNEAP
jgi:PHD/YefM family antitoxin component YafN of YafNO toxin-antitoxin module